MIILYLGKFSEQKSLTDESWRLSLGSSSIKESNCTCDNHLPLCDQKCGQLVYRQIVDIIKVI